MVDSLGVKIYNSKDLQLLQNKVVTYSINSERPNFKLFKEEDSRWSPYTQGWWGKTGQSVQLCPHC